MSDKNKIISASSSNNSNSSNNSSCNNPTPSNTNVAVSEDGHLIIKEGNDVFKLPFQKSRSVSGPPKLSSSFSKVSSGNVVGREASRQASISSTVTTVTMPKSKVLSMSINYPGQTDSGILSLRVTSKGESILRIADCKLLF